MKTFKGLSYEDRFKFLGFLVGHADPFLKDADDFDQFASGLVPPNQIANFLNFARFGRESIAVNVMDGFQQSVKKVRPRQNPSYNDGRLPDNRPHYKGT